jgi:hypothetical protein
MGKIRKKISKQNKHPKRGENCRRRSKMKRSWIHIKITSRGMRMLGKIWKKPSVSNKPHGSTKTTPRQINIVSMDSLWGKIEF